MFPCQVARQGNGFPCRPASGKRPQAFDYNGVCGAEEAVFGAGNGFSRVPPRGTWSDKKGYDETARELTRRFAANFTEYEPFVGSEIKEVAIRAAA